MLGLELCFKLCWFDMVIDILFSVLGFKMLRVKLIMELCEFIFFKDLLNIII